jgi:KDO2-lipid IV(A) lauroyltransferase
MAQWSFESVYFLQHPDEIARITIEGKEYLDAALCRNKGVLILTAHLGNFPLLLLKLVKEGYTVNVMARPMRDEKTGDYIQSLRDRAGIKTILSFPRQECVKNTIKALRDNEIVVMLMDQNFGTGGVWVKFFGELAATPIGPIVFALRTQAAVVPAYISSQKPGQHCLKIFPAENLILKEDNNETILLNAIKFTRIIEGWIRDVPSQWSWIHRRWKSRPNDAMMNAKFRVEK